MLFGNNDRLNTSFNLPKNCFHCWPYCYGCYNDCRNLQQIRGTVSGQS